MRWFAIVLLTTLLSDTCVATAAPQPFPQFKMQEIDRSLKVGYGLRIVDLNQDGKLDIVVADANRVVWFDQAQDWKLRTIIENEKAGVKTDNVCLDVADIDGDGKLDVTLGADWQPGNTRTGGSLQWLRQGDTIDEPWAVHKVADAIPTLHRIHFADVDGDRRDELLVVPLRGERSTARENFMEVPVKLLSFAVPKDASGPWAPPTVVLDSTHSMHNIRRASFRPLPAIFTASAEGVGVMNPTRDGKWAWSPVGAGYQDDPKGNRGAGEVAAGMAGERLAFVAAIEPMHGHQVVTYTGDFERLEGKPATRTVVDDQLNAGHALWTADLDGDGTDEIIAGFREPAGPNKRAGVNVYRQSADRDWVKTVLDDGGMACEDLACGDLNGDGKVDVVAAGRATRNVRIYWNQGVPKE